MRRHSFYVASKFENKEAAASLMRELRVRGYLIEGDWTGHSTEGLTGDQLAGTLRAFAEEDRQAVERASFFVLLPVAPEATRSGAHLVEFGLALGLLYTGVGRRIAVVGGAEWPWPTHAPIFNALPAVEHYATVKDFLAALDLERQRLPEPWVARLLGRW